MTTLMIILMVTFGIIGLIFGEQYQKFRSMKELWKSNVCYKICIGNMLLALCSFLGYFIVGGTI